MNNIYTYARHGWLSTRLATIALVAALAAAAIGLNVVLLASGDSGTGKASSAVPARTTSANSQRHYLGGPGEGAPGMRTGSSPQPQAGPSNNSSDHLGARP